MVGGILRRHACRADRLLRDRRGACQYSATQPTFATGQPQRSVQIDAAYMDRAMPIIQRRITQAGIRLAHHLNLALDPAYRTAP